MKSLRQIGSELGAVVSSFATAVSHSVHQTFEQGELSALEGDLLLARRGMLLQPALTTSYDMSATPREMYIHFDPHSKDGQAIISGLEQKLENYRAAHPQLTADVA